MTDANDGTRIVYRNARCCDVFVYDPEGAEFGEVYLIVSGIRSEPKFSVLRSEGRHVTFASGERGIYYSYSKSSDYGNPEDAANHYFGLYESLKGRTPDGPLRAVLANSANLFRPTEEELREIEEGESQ